MSLIEVVVPALGESVTEATLNRWLKPDGAFVRVDEPVAELGTDKATQELPAPATGKLNHRAREGETLRIGAVIAVIDPEAVGPQPVATVPSAPTTAGSPNETAASATPSAAAPVAPTGPTMVTVPTTAGLASPAAARLLAEAQLSTADVVGTGPRGRITKGDVLSAMNQRRVAASPTLEMVPPSGQQPAGDGPMLASMARTIAAEPPTARSQRATTRSPMTHIRRRIAERLLESRQTTATLTTFNEADMSAIIDLRQRYNDRFEKKHGVKLGFMSFFVKAAIEALKAFPIINARIDGTDIIYYHYYDIGVAVSTDRGLMVPVIRDADRLSLAELERTIAELARKARQNQITVQDLEGGTFTITNGGVFGSLLSTPILNPPQSAILGMHAIQKRPVAIDNQIVIRPMMYLALSYDHRLIDGREAVQFLVRIKECIENPAILLLDLT